MREKTRLSSIANAIADAQDGRTSSQRGVRNEDDISNMMS